MQQSGKGTLRFRPDIEGLRGLAILLVVLSHARVPGFAAGFIGVDVFFVISGFLITGLLSEELRARGAVDYWAFYARRARRLAPALIAMVLLVTVAAIGWLPPETKALQLESGLSTLLWSANLYFAFAGFGYFSADADDSLFLHAWSLGVEEQFYLVWPWLLVWAWGRGGMGWRPPAGTVVVGFLACLLILSIDATSAYYLMPARLWQLAMGGLAYRLSNRASRISTQSLHALGWLGLAMIGLAVVLIDPQRPYPSWNSLLPTVGATCMVLAGSAGSGWLSRLTGSEFLRLPGRISYSWYLWHWPFLVFIPAMGLGWPRPLVVLQLVLASFLVAWASYALIEQPFRRQQRLVSRQAVGIAVLASLTLAIGLRLAGINAEKQATISSQASGPAIRVSMPSIYGQPGCDEWYQSDRLVPCETAGGDGKNGRMLFLGDSVGAQWLPALEHAAKAWDYRLVALTKSACPMVDEPIFYERINRRYVECERWRDKAVEFVEKEAPDVVVIGSTEYKFSAEQWTGGTERLVRRLASNGRRVVILAPTPMLPFHAVGCVSSQGKVVDGALAAPGCSTPLADHDPKQIIGHLRAATEQVPGSAVLYLNDLVCAGGQCTALIRGRLVYRDQRHLDAGFAASIATMFERRLSDAIGREASL